MAKCTQCKSKFDAPFWRYSTLCPQCKAAHLELAGKLRELTSTIMVTQCLVGLNVLVFIAMVIRGVSFIEPDTSDLLKWGASFGPLTLGAQPWRAFTSMFVHIGIIHLGLNMWCLWSLGQLAERLMGNGRFLLLYLLSGLGGSVLSLWLHPQLVCAGASGAIFGIAGGLVVIMAMKKAPFENIAMQARLKSMLFFIGYNLLYGMRGGIDNAAHVGGLVTGAVMGAVMPRLVPAGDWNSAPLSTIANESPQGNDAAFRASGAVLAVLLMGGFGYVRRQHTQSHPGAETVQMEMLTMGKADRENLQEAAKAIQAGKDTDHAIESLKTVVAHVPDSSLAHLILAEGYSQKLDFAKAVEEYQKSVALRPDYAPARSEYAYALIQNSQIDQAIIECNTALRTDPNDANAHNSLGVALERKNDLKGALNEYATAAKLDPNEKIFSGNVERVSAKAHE